MCLSQLRDFRHCLPPTIHQRRSTYWILPRSSSSASALCAATSSPPPNSAAVSFSRRAVKQSVHSTPTFEPRSGRIGHVVVVRCARWSPQKSASHVVHRAPCCLNRLSPARQVWERGGGVG